MRQLVHIRLESETLERAKAEADRQGISFAEFVRRSVENALGSPAVGQTVSAQAPVDPVLQAMADGLRKEAKSRQLPVETIIQTWFGMMRPLFGTEKVPTPIDLRMNKDLTEPGEKS